MIDRGRTAGNGAGPLRRDSGGFEGASIIDLGRGAERFESPFLGIVCLRSNNYF